MGKQGRVSPEAESHNHTISTLHGATPLAALGDRTHRHSQELDEGQLLDSSWPRMPQRDSGRAIVHPGDESIGPSISLFH